SASWMISRTRANGSAARQPAASMVSPQKTRLASIFASDLRHEESMFSRPGRRNLLHEPDLDPEWLRQVLIHSGEHAFAASLRIVLCLDHQRPRVTRRCLLTLDCLDPGHCRPVPCDTASAQADGRARLTDGD